MMTPMASSQQTTNLLLGHIPKLFILLAILTHLASIVLIIAVTTAATHRLFGNIKPPQRQREVHHVLLELEVPLSLAKTELFELLLDQISLDQKTLPLRTADASRRCIAIISTLVEGWSFTLERSR